MVRPRSAEYPEFPTFTPESRMSQTRLRISDLTPYEHEVIDINSDRYHDRWCKLKPVC